VLPVFRHATAMTTVFRHALSILLLPFVVLVVVPRWLLTAYAGNGYRWAAGSLAAWTARSAGSAVFLAGLFVFAWCVKLFAQVGRGTLAPWDPTHALVAVGPYRFVRNPMIGGVALMLAGEALFSGSWPLGLWVCLFFAVNHVYFVLLEEPGLERRFGEDYRKYKKKVPRWLPRLTRRAGR
jgi:protein-S-isoprenylcysteine O-methyltransferase Ste14